MMQAPRRWLYILLLSLPVLASGFITGCGGKSGSPSALTGKDTAEIVQKILAHRSNLDAMFRNNPDSPFNDQPPIPFTGLKYFPINLKFRFVSKLTKYPRADTVIILGTKGEPRKNLKYGYFTLESEGKDYRINVYKFTPEEGANYERIKNALNVWFTDETTGKESYHVGRYLDVGEENSDPDFAYVVDFNDAYNPYCCYNPSYTCAVPLREDHLPFRVEAGEVNYK
jgi:uncharacterized protein (DUF1684 family)